MSSLSMATSSKREWLSCLSSHQLPNTPLMDLGPQKTPSSHPCWSFAWLTLMSATAMLCPEASISQLSSQPRSLYFLSSPSFEKFPSLGRWAVDIDKPTTAEHSTLVWLFNQLIRSLCIAIGQTWDTLRSPPLVLYFHNEDHEYSQPVCPSPGPCSHL